MTDKTEQKWQMVPVEPDKSMVDAGTLGGMLTPNQASVCFQSMCIAAPDPWQPIDSAPKDGTLIWCYLPEFDEQAVLRWVRMDEWSGWQYVDSLLNDCLDSELEPSHWTHLLPRPKA